MKWILVVIALTSDDVMLAEGGEFEQMTACFEKREEIIERVGRPLVNYQVICIPKSEEITW